MLDFDKDRVARRLNQMFPTGINKYGSSIGMTRELAIVTLQYVAEEYKRIGSDIYLVYERDKRGIDLRNFVACVAGHTVTVPMVVSPLVVRLDQRVICVDRPDGAVALMDALLAEVEMAIEEGRERA